MRKKQSKSTGTKRKAKTRDSWVNKGVVVDPQRTQPPEGPRVSDGYGGAQGSQGREGQDRDGGGDNKAAADKTTTVSPYSQSKKA